MNMVTIYPDLTDTDSGTLTILTRINNSHKEKKRKKKGKLLCPLTCSVSKTK